MITQRTRSDSTLSARGAAATAETDPEYPPVGNMVERVAHVPEVIPAGTIAVRALVPLPYFLDGIEPGETFLIGAKHGQYLTKKGDVKPAFADVWIAVQAWAGVRVGNRIVTRQCPWKVSHDDAAAAIDACNNPQGLKGKYAGAVRIISEAEALDWVLYEQSMPPDPTRAANGIYPPNPSESPRVRVKSNMTGEWSVLALQDGQEFELNEWMAVCGTFRKTRHGESFVTVLGKLSDRGERFKSALAAFVETASPDWTSESPGFPSYFSV